MSNSEAGFIQSSKIMALGTIASRITGLARGLLLVAVLGTTLLGDTYNIANTMPNILYTLIIGGALTAVFVPQIVRSLRESDGGSAFISRLLTATVVVLGGLVAISVLFAPILVRLFASSYVGRPEFQLTVLFMRYCLPQIFFMGIFALLGQIANAKNKFGPMMWAPVANNLVAILIFGYYLSINPHWTVKSITSTQVAILGLGTTLGYVVQAAVLIPVIKRTRIALRPRFDWRDPELKKSLHMAGWTLLFAAISQVSYLVTVNLSTHAAVSAERAHITTGVGFTPYTNAYFILLLPHSIVTISLVTALLPHLSVLAIDKKFSEIHDKLVRAIRLVGILIVPASMGFLLFGPLIARSIFFGISIHDANYVGYVLVGFALGLLPLSVNLIALRGLNAFENVKSQVWSNLLMNIAAIAFSGIAAFFLPAQWTTVGLAVALSASNYCGAFVTIRLLRRYEIWIHGGEIIYFYLKLAATFLLIAMPLRLVEPSLPGGNILHLVLVLLVSGVGYFGIAKLLKVTEVQSTVSLLLGTSRDRL